MSVGNPVATIAITDSNSKMQQQFRAWTQDITAAVNELQKGISELQTLSGAGSPEGVVTASPTRLYMDTSGTAGLVLYVKQTGTDNTGWVLV